MATMSYTLEGEVNVEIIITESGDGSLTFTINVLDDTGSIGDLNAFFFDLTDDTKTDGLIIEGADVTDTALDADSITKIDNYTNMNGEVVKDLGKFDGGIQFGTQGISQDDIQTTTFTMSHADGLTLEDFNLQDFGIRLTSVGEMDGSREDSLKLGGTLPEAPEEPPTGPTNIANDDTMTVTEANFFNPPELGIFDILDGADPFDLTGNSLLANDTSDGGAYVGEVAAVNDFTPDPVTGDVFDPMAIGQIIEHPDGGALIVYANGAVDFSVAGTDGINDFAYLDADAADVANQQAVRVFEYAIDGGDTASLTVTILGLSDGDTGGPGGPGGF